MNFRKTILGVIHQLSDELCRTQSLRGSILVAQLVELLERRTRYIVWRSGLMMTIFVILGSMLSAYVRRGNLDISGGNAIAIILLALIALAVVEFLNWRLQRKPLETQFDDAFAQKFDNSAQADD